MPTLSPLRVLILGEDKYSKEFKKMNAKVAAVGKSIRNAGSTMTRYLTVPLVGAGVLSLKMSRDLNKAMANVGTLIPGEIKKLEEYKNKVQDLSIETGIASTTIAEGLYETISAFPDARDPIGKLAIATKMGKAGLSTTKEALTLLSAATKGYGDTSDEAAQKVADLAFMVVKQGQTTFPDLASSMGAVIPLAATLKISQEELFGSMATLTGVTGNASEVVTQLQSILGAVVKPSEEMNRAARRTAKSVVGMGFSSASAMVQEIGLIKSMEVFKKAAGGSADKMMGLMRRKEALTAALALTGNQQADLTEKTRLMTEAAGAQEEAFKQQTEGIDKDGFKWDQFIRRLQKLAVTFGDKLFPLVVRILDKVEPLINKFLAMDDATLELTLKVAGAVAIFGPLLMVVGQSIIVFSVLLKILGPGFGLLGMFRRVGGPLRGLIGLFRSLKGAALGAGGAMKGVGGATIPTPGAPGVGGAVGAARGGIPLTGGTLIGVAAAGTIGVAIGTVLNEKYFAPQNQKMADLLSSAESFSSANARTIDEVDKALADLEVKQKEFSKTPTGTEFMAGGILSFFGLAEDPIKRYGEALDNLTREQKKLQDKKIALLREEATASAGVGVVEGEAWRRDPLVMKYLEEARQKAEADITIDFLNLPKGAEAKVAKEKGGKVKVKNPGAVMEGGV